jgi:hypothetical protein
MTPYENVFAIGTPVRIKNRMHLEHFVRVWKYHNSLRDEQIAFADVATVVADVGFYHGGDPLYRLNDVPGVWHEDCLSPVSGESCG